MPGTQLSQGLLVEQRAVTSLDLQEGIRRRWILRDPQNLDAPVRAVTERSERRSPPFAGGPALYQCDCGSSSGCRHIRAVLGLEQPAPRPAA